jgi:hypothetical protein
MTMPHCYSNDRSYPVTPKDPQLGASAMRKHMTLLGAAAGIALGLAPQRSSDTPPGQGVEQSSERQRRHD